MMVEELLMQRSMYKALVTKSSRTLSCLIKEGDINLIQKHGVKMKAWFHSFDDVCESYLETLTNETDITAADSYYDVVYDNYMDQLDSLNLATDTLSMHAPAIVKGVLPQSPTLQVQDDQCNKSVQISTHQQNTELVTNNNPTLSTMLHIINLPTIVSEQETIKPPIHSVQLDDQSNETVPMNSHLRTSQLSPNSGLSLPVPHLDVETKSHVSMATATMRELPEQIDCGTPVINQSSPVSLDPHIDQTDFHVQSPTPCAQYSHTHHATIHHARIVPSPIQLANSRSTDHHVLNAPPQHPLKLKVSSVCSQTPRPGRKVKDGTFTCIPRPAACFIPSGVT